MGRCGAPGSAAFWWKTLLSPCGQLLAISTLIQCAPGSSTTRRTIVGAATARHWEAFVQHDPDSGRHCSLTISAKVNTFLNFPPYLGSKQPKNIAHCSMARRSNWRMEEVAQYAKE